MSCPASRPEPPRPPAPSASRPTTRAPADYTAIAPSGPPLPAPLGRALSGGPEVLEACTLTGPGDMWCRVVARSNTDLQRVIDAVLSIPGIVRSATVIALATQVPYRVQPRLGV